MDKRVKLTIKAGSFRGQEFLLPEHVPCVVGRASDCWLWLPSDGENLFISRHHCVLDVDPPSIRVRDCGSRNGTFVNGENIGPPGIEDAGYVPLHDGDELRVGSITFQVDVQSAPDACEVALAGSSAN